MTQRKTLKSAAVAGGTNRLYLDLWRKGFISPLKLAFDSYKAANAFRLRLYVAIRPYRERPEMPAELQQGASIAQTHEWDARMAEYREAHELFRIIDQTEAVAKTLPSGEGMLIIRTIENNVDLARIAAQAGIPWGFDREVEESQRRMLEKLKGYDPQVRPLERTLEEDYQQKVLEDEQRTLQSLKELSAKDIYGDSDNEQF